MKVLVANDDGIKSRGIYELVKALSAKADVYVVAPESQRSASGHGITIAKPIRVEKVEFDNARLAYQISGTPADCVKLGMEILSKENIKVDMVFTGINHGGNLGNDTLYSGTVSAALEGSICGVPSVAVSVCSHQAEYFDYACELAAECLEKAKGKLAPETVLNINVPNLPKDEIKGLRYASLGKVEYREFFDVEELESGKRQYLYGGEPIAVTGLPETTDVMSMQEGYATITPLHSDLTDYSLINEVRKWRIGE
ncbi:MAG: 5'/3'-nucleotidase SurE [Clostridiales bacterium]|nr:5'/3'-nucleotidase SurE [Clostridiales bacterium]